MTTYVSEPTEKAINNREASSIVMKEDYTPERNWLLSPSFIGCHATARADDWLFTGAIK